MMALKFNFKVHPCKENQYKPRVITSSFQFSMHCSIYFIALLDALAKFAFSVRAGHREEKRCNTVVRPQVNLPPFDLIKREGVPLY